MSFLTPRILSAAIRAPLPFARAFTTAPRWQNEQQTTPPPPAERVSSMPSLSSFAGSTNLPTDQLSSAQTDIATSFLRNSLPGGGNPFTSSEETPATPESWWRETYGSRTWSKPGNAYTGRSVTVPLKSSDAGVATAVKRLNGILTRNRIKRELRLGEYYEKPSERKKRLAVERHRRRFQDLVRQKVQLVQAIRNRS